MNKALAGILMVLLAMILSLIGLICIITYGSSFAQGVGWAGYFFINILMAGFGLDLLEKSGKDIWRV